LFFLSWIRKREPNKEKKKKNGEETEEAIWIARARHKCPHFSTKVNIVGGRVKASLGKESY